MNTAVDRTVVRLKDFRATEVGKRVANAIGSIADHVVQGVQGWSTRAKGAANGTHRLVRSNPWRTAGAVALVGVAAGLASAMLVRRSRYQRRLLPAGADSISELSGG